VKRDHQPIPMPRKVIHVITRLDRGGSAQNTLLTALGHDRSRYEPLVADGPPGRWTAQGGDVASAENARRLQEAGIRTYRVTALTRELNVMKDLMALAELIALFRRERPVIVHTHTSKAGVLGRLAAWLTGVPVIIHTPHGHVFYGHFGRFLSWFFLLIEWLLAKLTIRLIALTEAERDEHLERGVGRRDRFAVIPSGIDLRRFKNVAGTIGQRPDGFACPADAVVVGSIGWLTPVKGHRYLIEALSKLKPSHPRLYVVIVGGGELQGTLADLAAGLDVGDAVRLLGERDDVLECLAAMDLFVMPSLNEGMGRALIEAMAAGRPVVATRVGGIPAIVKDRRNGLLVPPGDASSLGAAIAELIQRPAWAKGLGAAASDSVGPRFGVTAMVAAVEGVYEAALHESR